MSRTVKERATHEKPSVNDFNLEGHWMFSNIRTEKIISIFIDNSKHTNLNALNKGVFRNKMGGKQGARETLDI